MSKKIYAKTIAHKVTEPASSKLELVRQHDKLKQTTEFKTIAEQAARSSIFYKNFYVEELREKYKNFDRFKRIDKAFPYAKLKTNEAALVLFDEPKTEMDLEICLRKAGVLKEMGYNYAIIEQDSTLFDVLEQLGAI